MLPPTTQQQPLGATVLMTPDGEKVNVIAAKFSNGDRPQVQLHGDFDIDQIVTITRQLLEQAEISSNSSYYPLLQAAQSLQAQQGQQGQVGRHGGQRAESWERRT